MATNQIPVLLTPTPEAIPAELIPILRGEAAEGGGGAIDAVPTDGSTNPVSSNGVFDALSGKSDNGHNHSGTYDPAGTAASAAATAQSNAISTASSDATTKANAAQAAAIAASTPAAHAGSGGAAHANAVAAGAAGFMSGADKTKLDGIADGAQVNPASTDALTEGSTNLYHTAARVRATVLTGLSTALGTAVTAAHTVLEAIGFLQRQVSDNATAISGKQATLVSGTNIKTINSTSLLGSGDLTVSAAPGGSDTQVQYNSAGAFAGASNITTDGSRLDFSAMSGTAAASCLKLAGQYGDVYVGAYAGLLVLGTNNTNIGAATNCRIGPIDISLASTGSIGFASSATSALGTGSDTALKRDSAGVMKVTDGGSNLRDLKLRNLIASGNLATGIVHKTAAYTATTNDHTITVDASAGAVTITGFACSGNAGKRLTIKKTDASGNAVTFDPNASETVDGASTKATSTQYGGFTVQVNAAGTEWAVVATF